MSQLRISRSHFQFHFVPSRTEQAPGGNKRLTVYDVILKIILKVVLDVVLDIDSGVILILCHGCVHFALN